MGLRSGLPHLGSPRRCVADLAAAIQLASAAQQSKSKSAHQPPRSDRGQPVEAPQLAICEANFDPGRPKASAEEATMSPKPISTPEFDPDANQITPGLGAAGTP